jgi:hypothetical protein
MRTDLATDPAVVVIARATRLQTYAVVGRLHTLWAWADGHTESGRIPGIDAAWIDKHVERRGFASAMVAAGWLVVDADGIEFPKYTDHNGATAKRRAKEARRKGEGRSVPHSVRKVSAFNADNLRNRGEERREEKKEPPYPPSESEHSGPSFLAFWQAYPPKGKTRQDKCRPVWNHAVSVEGIDPALIVRKATEYAVSDKGRGQFCLSAPNWLEGRCWDDSPEAWKDAKDEKPKGVYIPQ